MQGLPAASGRAQGRWPCGLGMDMDKWVVGMSLWNLYVPVGLSATRKFTEGKSCHSMGFDLGRSGDPFFVKVRHASCTLDLGL